MTMSDSLRCWILSSLVSALAVATAGDSLAAKPAIGDQVSGVRFKDIRYLQRSLDDLVVDKPVATKAVVLVFTNTTCPLVQRYLPRLKELDKEFRDQGLVVASVNVSPTESVADMATQAVEFDLPFACVQDIEGTTVAACGVDRTPQVVVLDGDLRLRYRGRIDDQYRIGGSLPKPTRSYLREAVEAVLAGHEVKEAETTVDGCVITPPSKPPTESELTFYKDIQPLMAQHCQACHQPGTTAPFSLMSYDDVAGVGEMIAEVVDEGRMPPWYASGKHGKFMNDRMLDRATREKIVSWVRSGMTEGEASTDTPTVTIDFAGSDPDAKWGNQRWFMGKPDMILTVPAVYEVPADGYIDYRYAVLPMPFLSDTWVAVAEVQPDNPRVVHHANLGFATVGEDIRRAKLITGYVPGVGPMELDKGVASKIPAGSVLGLQIHLVTTGKPEKARIRVGLRFPRYEVEKELRYVELANTRFAIPPYDPHYRVTREKQVDKDVTLVGFFVHMHLRGKASEFLARTPDGKTESILMVPNYNFDWQLPYYVEPGAVKFPAGTRFECVSHFDNSPFNAYNPDPAKRVRDGQQTIDEMMYGFVFYTEDNEHLGLKVNPKTGVDASKGMLKGLLGGK